MNAEGWRPLRRPKPEVRGAEGFIVTPFVRLARVHAVGAAADGAITAALAGSIFFSISPEESRGRVALALLLTMAPFAVVTPLIGPAIDRVRGGRRMMIIATMVARAVVAFLMIRHVDTLFLFPEVFGILVLQKGYSVAKSAVVPQLVKSDQDLVGANSQLALISAIAGPTGAMVAGAFSVIGGPAVAAGVGLIGFLVATVLAFQLTPVVVAADPVEDLERAELRDARILLAATSMMIVRGIVGFVTMLLMFELRGGKDGLDVSTEGAALGGAAGAHPDYDSIVGDPRAPVWHFGVVAVAAVTGTLCGARFAPALRQRVSEERMLAGALLAIIAAAMFAAFSGDLFGTGILAFTVSAGAGTGKLSFDALVQRDAPDANYGRSFARFEARFQLAFAIGAFVPVVIPLGVVVGAWLVAAAAGFAAFSYLVGKPGRAGLKRRPTPAATADEGHGADESVADDTMELTVDDIRPSQPAPPAAATEWAAQDWDDAAPYVSSIDGVEVDPSPPDSVEPQTRPDDDVTT